MMKLRTFARAILGSSASLVAFAAVPALAQDAAAAPNASAAAAADEDTGTAIVVTGSRLKQDPAKSAVPLEIITNQTIQQNGISSPEQLNMFLTSTGSGPDNLASNSDVVTGAQRGTNGLSSANLRGQGSAATLVLLNGRRVAAHGLSGGAVDVNQIPFAAIDRVEVLKDGASAIYGADAVGGVINYITKKNFRGLSLSGMSDITEQGGGNIYRLGGVAGMGDLDSDGFNVMGAVSYGWNQILRGSQRDFVNGNQPNRGLSIDTRGTPIATLFGTGNTTTMDTLLRGVTLTAPNGANAVAGGVNTLNLPGGAGCQSMDGGMAYDYQLWNTPTAYYACAWDTGRAAVIQQPIETLTYYGKATINLGGGHQIYGELTGSSATSAKSFSNAQLTANTSNLAWQYPLNALTKPTYDQIFNALVTAFPTQAATLNARYGKPLTGRWRCDACGPREYVTHTRTLRASVGVEGPLPFAGWDYKVDASHAESEASSVLGTGYYYRGTLASGAADPLAPIAPGATLPGLVGLINAGILNPFSIEQTPAALAGLAAISAKGTTLYGGRYTVNEADASISGPLFDMGGGKAQLALGVDLRRETYSFNGSAAAAATAPVIFLAAFDNVNALTPKHRDIRSAYAELSLPLFEGFDITGAVRYDDYSDFGGTTNPKVSARYQPTEWLMFRGSYNTSFRAPGFNQLYNGVTLSPYSGSDLADPVRCPGGVPTSAFGSGQPCAAIRPDIATSGDLNLKAETASQYSLGVVLSPRPGWSLSADYWSIDVHNPIVIPTLRQIIDNASYFPTRFVRDPITNNITVIDQRWGNTGDRQTRGIEFALRGGFDLGSGNNLSLGMDGSLLVRKREKIAPNAPYVNLLGVFSFTGDLGNRWKHNAWLTFSNHDYAITLTQIYRSGYANQALPGIAAGTVTRPDYNPRVKAYMIYNLSVSVLNLGPTKFTFGVKNLFNTDPPFAITYDGNSGAGSSWEPRIADPRGRSFTVQAEIKF
ncbi:MAG: TonB-dependent receptor domain-containing protein [Novosphingobium sp.]